MKQQFLEKCFPTSRAASIRKDICGIRQFNGETLHEYWERFKQLCASCSHHQIPDQLSIQYFYKGLSTTDRKIINAASGGALVNKTPTEARRIISSIAANGQQFGERQDYDPRKVKEETRASIQNLDNQVSQLAAAFNRWESQGSRKLPSQTVINPKQNVSAITLRNDKELPQLSQRISEQAIEEAIEKEEMAPKPKDVPQQKFRDESLVVVTPLPPFPSRFAKSKKKEQEQEVFDIFHKVEVNIPLLNAIKQIPQYAKFLRELCTTKKKLKGFEKIYMGENVSALLQQKLPPKYKNPSIFIVPCKIRNVKVEKALIDLGAAINIMPRSIYNSLNLGPLKETSVIMQLADRSNAYPDGVLDDILVQVDKLVFPADFYVLDRDDDFSVSLPILLGRPFLMTSKTKIDVYSGTLTMEFDGEIIKFNICDAIKCSSEAHSVFVIDVIDPFIQQKFELNGRDTLKVVINRNLDS
ncbi:uncharacterized protein [Coffea arabica]|uniref:Retrotransposon gag domain-containing protein n=1 Tax=Coffea arabica TaxID=13443 RepID=A0A6P6SP86_COFAR|nr:uncharacterized protein LOC113693343 [Coffea arabica]